MEECILPIDPVAVIRQFDRLALRQSVRSLSPSFLTAEISKRMNERLDYIRLDPKYIVDAGCGNGDAIQRLAARYKNTTILGLDASEGQLAVARERWPVEGMRSLWRKATGRPKIQFQKADAGYFVPPWPIDLLWSNCFLHWVPQPHKMIAHWTNILAPGGLLMLSCFGPDSFKQIRAAAKIAGLPGAVLPFVDMHDLGDMLVASQLTTPVMDAEILTLTYATAPALLADMRVLGGNPHLQRSPSLTGKARWQRFIQALEDNAGPDGRLCLTVEIIYGHGWRPLSQPNALRSQQIPLDVLAASLPSRRTHPKQG